MRSTFFGLEIGYRGLVTHQAALDVTGNNISNASTPGYSRQRAEITSTEPFTYPAFNRSNAAGQMGTGSQVSEILRIRDELIDAQIRRNTSSLGYWESSNNLLGQLESIVNEPDTESGNIRTAVDAFWSALEDFSKSPESMELRTPLLEAAITMTDFIKSDYNQFQLLREDTNQRIVNKVDELNRLAEEIAELNNQIGKITALGDNPNDLLDRRDQLVEEASKIVNISTTVDAQNRMSLTIQGIPLVNGITANKITTTPNPNDESMVELRWQALNMKVDVRNGELKGLLEARDELIPEILKDLDNFAFTMINSINNLHRTGYGLDGSTDEDFFVGSGACDIYVSSRINDGEAGLRRIAGSSTKDGLEGNNEIALAMAKLADLKLFINGSATMGDFMGTLISKIGSWAQEADLNTEHYTLLIENLDSKRESISGVSMEEETTNMLRFNQGFNAAAKIINMMDEMLDVIVNQLKLF